MQRPQDDVVPLHEPFETALRGFNRQQVLAHIESLEGQISMVRADRESVLAQVAELCRVVDHLREESELLAHLRREAEKANERVELMHQAPMVAASARIQHIIRLAEEEAAELRTRTQKESEAMLRDTSRRCAELEAESQRRREAAEQRSELEIARKEQEANDRIHTRSQHSLAALHLMLRIVAAQWAHHVAALEGQKAELVETHARIGKEVTELAALRADITAQLTATRHMVAEALEQVQHTPIDDSRPNRPVPIQRVGRPAAKHGAEGATAQSVQSANHRTDERRNPVAPA